ncbi:MAG TPA: caspase family protein [Thermoanaerobaculia bacterium]|nr:caspase family protein [Thermoanaerobaculia bacterium]
MKLIGVTLLTVLLGRGVQLLVPASSSEVRAERFDPKQSAAIFMGARHFPNDSALGEVRYAVDDAVNMAWLFALDARVSLVPPERVVLLLEGAPQKDKSKVQLRQLTDAGAHIEHADRDTVESALRRQAESVGGGGVLIASFATHGFSSDGASYIAASSSVYSDLSTSIPTARLMEIAAKAPRSLLFFDACRERKGSRAAPLPPPFVEALSQSAGQVVMTVSGEFAWENPIARNGAFTAAVIAGLQCKAETDRRGFVTVDTLADYAEKTLLKYVKKHYDPYARHAIRVISDGDSDDMPLAQCTLPPSIFRTSPARVAFDDDVITAFDAKGLELWRSIVSGRIAEATVADLDGDGANEVVLSADGKLAVLHPDGKLWWSKDLRVPDNYAHAGQLRLTKFIVGDLFRKKRQQIVALSADDSGAPSSRVSVFDGDGTDIGGYFHPGRLLDAAIARPTSRHAPKIIVTAENPQLHDLVSACGKCSGVFLLDPKKVQGEAPPYHGKLKSGSQVWYGYVLAPRIERLEIADRDRDGHSDICLEIPNGSVAVDFAGTIIEAKNAQFGLVK